MPSTLVSFEQMRVALAAILALVAACESKSKVAAERAVESFLCTKLASSTHQSRTCIAGTRSRRCPSDGLNDGGCFEQAKAHCFQHGAAGGKIAATFTCAPTHDECENERGISERLGNTAHPCRELSPRELPE
jgi:hypothetical protein